MIWIVRKEKRSLLFIIWLNFIYRNLSSVKIRKWKMLFQFFISRYYIFIIYDLQSLLTFWNGNDLYFGLDILQFKDFKYKVRKRKRSYREIDREREIYRTDRESGRREWGVFLQRFWILQFGPISIAVILGWLFKD